MASPLDVFVTEPTEIDLDVFCLWLSGEGVDEATEKRLAREPPSNEFDDYKDLLMSETRGYFRLFGILEPYLQLPSRLLKQGLVQLPLSVKQAMIQHYYAFDERVVREFLGKKLSTKNRKDLDDVSEKTRVPLKNCRRQFDNIKQVLQVVDDYEGSLVENIKAQFSLSEDLARSYASVVFINHNRFETQKKKLSHLLFSDFTYCASEMIDHWTAGSEGSHVMDDDLELDRVFLQELHDLRIGMLDRVWIDRHLKLILKDLRKQKCHPSYVKQVEQNGRSFLKSIISFGASLIHRKDLKDFFVDVTDDILIPFHQLGWGREDVRMFLLSVRGCYLECEQVHSRPATKGIPWSCVYMRYLDTLNNCLLALYKL